VDSGEGAKNSKRKTLFTFGTMSTLYSLLDPRNGGGFSVPLNFAQNYATFTTQSAVD
jgi:hypothetical protein